MQFDAVILAGGRSSRLGGEPKAGLLFRGRTLLEIAVEAASAAQRIVVVGDPVHVDSPTSAGSPSGEAPRPAASPIAFVRENPPYGGPAAAIAAGVRALTSGEPLPTDFVLVLACDMPDVAPAVDALLTSMAASDRDGRTTHDVASVSGSRVDGAMARDVQGRDQPLVALYRRTALEGAIAARARSTGLDGLSVRALIAPLVLAFVPVPAGATDDVDTWADAERRGITPP